MSLNKHIISCIETYRNLLKRTAEEIENYIFSYKSTRKEELSHFDAWPEVISQKERDWIRYNFMPTSLHNYKAPNQVIVAVKKANDVLFELTDLKGFDKHLNNKKYSEKKIDILFEAASVLTSWGLDKEIEQTKRDIIFEGVKVNEPDESNSTKKGQIKMTEPSAKDIFLMIEKLETLKSKQTDFINKKLNEIGKVNEKTAEPSENTDKPKKPKRPEIPSQEEILTGKPARKLTYTQEAINNLRTKQVFESIKSYERQRRKPKEYWPEEIQSLIDEIEILMYPYEELKAYGELLKTGEMPLDYVIQEMKKSRHKIKIKTRQKSAEKARPASGKAGEILEAQAKPLILQLAEKLRVMHKFSYRIIASLPFSITTLDSKKATPAPITTSDDIPANCKFLTTWEDVFDSYSNAFEQFLLWNEDAISLASNIQYEKNRELLISLTRIKHRATEILSSIKHDRKSKSTLASGQDEIDTARGSLTNLLNCDLPDCSAVDFFVELKDLPSFADELEVASHISAPEMTAGKAGETKNKPDTENIAVDDKELTILIELNAGDNKTFSQVEIAASASIKRGTLKDKLLRLEKIGLVHRPLGKRRGYQITDKGREIAKRHQ